MTNLQSIIGNLETSPDVKLNIQIKTNAITIRFGVVVISKTIYISQKSAIFILIFKSVRSFGCRNLCIGIFAIRKGLERIRNFRLIEQEISYFRS